MGAVIRTPGPGGRVVGLNPDTVLGIVDAGELVPRCRLDLGGPDVAELMRLADDGNPHAGGVN